MKTKLNTTTWRSPAGSTGTRFGFFADSDIEMVVPGAVTNAMTVDVEDYFQVSAFENRVRRKDWDSYPLRVGRNVETILKLFADYHVHATFFVLGWVAERQPEIVKRIAAAGHEIASHGYGHQRVNFRSPDQFRTDVGRARKLLEDISGLSVRGYRAPSFSINGDTPWAFEILAEEGYAYSSSIYPIRHDLYGMPEAPRFPFRPLHGHALMEIPITTFVLGGLNLPCGGGGYFRLLPRNVCHWGIQRVNERERKPAVFYFHPWEIDPDQPRIDGASAKARFRHYSNLKHMRRKLEKTLSRFSWDRMDRVFGVGADGER